MVIQSKHCFLKSARLKSQNVAFTIVDWTTLLLPQFVDQPEGSILSGLLIGQSNYLHPTQSHHRDQWLYTEFCGRIHAEFCKFRTIICSSKTYSLIKAFVYLASIKTFIQNLKSPTQRTDEIQPYEAQQRMNYQLASPYEICSASAIIILATSNSHNSYTFQASSLKFCMKVHLDNL